MADCTSIETRLARARATFDDWMNGQVATRFVDQNGESVSYSTGGLARLEAYIAKLEAQLASCQNGTPMYRGPLRFTF